MFSSKWLVYSCKNSPYVYDYFQFNVKMWHKGLILKYDLGENTDISVDVTDYFMDAYVKCPEERFYWELALDG